MQSDHVMLNFSFHTKCGSVWEWGGRLTGTVWFGSVDLPSPSLAWCWRSASVTSAPNIELVITAAIIRGWGSFRWKRRLTGTVSESKSDICAWASVAWQQKIKRILTEEPILLPLLLTFSMTHILYYSSVIWAGNVMFILHFAQWYRWFFLFSPFTHSIEEEFSYTHHWLNILHIQYLPLVFLS